MSAEQEWKRRALEAEGKLARVTERVEANRGNRTAPYAGTSNYVPIAEIEEALRDHDESPTSAREIPTSDDDGPTVKWCGWCDVAGHTTDECPTPGRVE